MIASIKDKLEDRSLVNVSGPEAVTFLQNIVTQDVANLKNNQMVYSCLLTPQGRFLHDFFISPHAEGFYLECDSHRRTELIRRLNLFKLRSKISIEDCHDLFDTYISPVGNPENFKDPRLNALGFRLYLPKTDAPAYSTAYRDKRISLGVPEDGDIKPEVDTISDANLDCLNAVSWDKGCYVGQEVTARMRNRGLVKKRMVIVSGARLTAGDTLMQSGYPVGEVRAVDSSHTVGLAILKLAALAEEAGHIKDAAGASITAKIPDWLTH